jgi:HD-like signal output (HDOD) protein
VLTALIRETRDDDPDLRKVARLVSEDVGLAATVLKTVNSPFYGLRRPAGSVQQALAMLGLVATTQLVTGLLLRQAFPAGNDPAMERYWEHSARIAALSALNAATLRTSDRDVTHTFGLFRDCGMPPMLARYKAQYEDVMRGVSGIEAETERFGTHHGRIGYLLAKSWLLPEEVCLAVRHHENPDVLRGAIAAAGPGCRNLIAAAVLAEHLHAAASGRRAVEAPDEHAALAMRQLGVDRGGLIELLEIAESETVPGAPHKAGIA